MTFSGGEPLFQPEFLRDLLLACKEHELHTALDTCGFAPFRVLDSMRDLVDLFLFDIKHLDDARHRELTGVSNRLILENLELLSGLGQNIYLRIPLIPGLNDDPEHLHALASYASRLPHLLRIDLLPYHAAGLEKYIRLDKPARLTYSEPFSPTQLEEIQLLFQSYGLETCLGG